MRGRLLVVSGSLQPPGGGPGVGAWMVQALAGRHDVEVLTWDPVDRAEADRYFGTSLSGETFRVREAWPRLRRVLDRLPVPLALLRLHLLGRRSRELAPHFDLVLSACNEFDPGVRAVQYIHYPWSAHPRPDAAPSWYSHPLKRAILRAWYAFCHGLSGFTAPGSRRHRTLVNSAWTGELVRRALGAEPEVLHPPAAGRFPDVPWEERAERFVVLGRFTPEKRIPELVAVLERVRRAGHPVRLAIVGTPTSGFEDYAATVEAVARQEWVTLHRDLPRAEVARMLAGSRYGIHGMLEEHYGMAVAEMVRAGCLAFVPDGGGAREIVASCPELLYGSDDGAVEGILRVLRDPGLQESLRRRLDPIREDLGEERFMERIRAVVDEELASRAPVPARPAGR